MQSQARATSVSGARSDVLALLGNRAGFSADILNFASTRVLDRTGSGGEAKGELLRSWDRDECGHLGHAALPVICIVAFLCNISF